MIGIEEVRRVLDEAGMVTFEEEKHEYSKGNQNIPCVSEVIYGAVAYKYRGIGGGVLAKAGSRGTAVHDAIHMLSLGWNADGLPLEVEPYMKAYADYRDQKSVSDAVLIGNEMILTDEGLNLAGTVDEIRYIGGKVVILDYKTTAEPDVKNWTLQLTGYGYMLMNRLKCLPEDVILGVVHLKADGTYTEYPIQLNMAMFKHCWALYNYEMGGKI